MNNKTALVGEDNNKNNKKQLQDEQRLHAIFYNIFINDADLKENQTLSFDTDNHGDKNIEEMMSYRQAKSFTIVREQLGQVHDFIVGRGQFQNDILLKRMNGTTLYFNLIGAQNIPTQILTNSIQSQPFCQQQQKQHTGQGGEEKQSNTSFSNTTNHCHLLKHYPNGGNEHLTLHKLHEYCQSHPNHLVTYIHNKGSYSPHAANIRMRRIATRAVLSSTCMNKVMNANIREDDTEYYYYDYDNQCNKSENKTMMNAKLTSCLTCNICGSTFQSSPHRHFTANMFTAHCRYISQLLPPLDYRSQRHKFCHEHYTFPIANESDINCPLRTVNNGTFVGQEEEGEKTTATLRSSEYGFGRYSMEWWPVSHLAARPCSVFMGSFNKCPVEEWCNWKVGFIPGIWRRQRFPFWAHIKLQHLLLQSDYLYNKNTTSLLYHDDRDAYKYCRYTFQLFRENPCEWGGLNGSMYRERLSFHSS